MDDHPSPCEWKQGYRYDPDAESYRCLFCAAQYESGEIFAVDGRLFDARKRMELHISGKHGSSFDAMLAQGKKVTGLTTAQQKMMSGFFKRIPDKEIAAATETSPSTVRYQRHALREKARQARVFLALSELMEESLARRDAEPTEPMVDIHPGATMVDDRYNTTEEEARRILEASFLSLVPMKLRALPPKEKKKLVVLRAIADRFERGVRYSGKDVDELLSSIHEDRASLRRYLIEYGFMDRTRDGREYWRI